MTRLKNIHVDSAMTRIAQAEHGDTLSVSRYRRAEKGTTVFVLYDKDERMLGTTTPDSILETARFPLDVMRYTVVYMVELYRRYVEQSRRVVLSRLVQCLGENPELYVCCFAHNTQGLKLFLYENRRLLNHVSLYAKDEPITHLRIRRALAWLVQESLDSMKDKNDDKSHS